MCEAQVSEKVAAVDAAAVAHIQTRRDVGQDGWQLTK